MKFQIINKQTKRAISLKEFDWQYTTFLNIEHNPIQYSFWFAAMKDILLLHSDLADNAFDSYFCKSQMEIKKHDRKLSFTQAASLLLVDNAHKLEVEDHIWCCVRYFKYIGDTYYIEYHI